MISDFLSDYNFILILLAITVAYAVGVFTLLSRISERRERERGRFFKALKEGMNSSAVSSLVDVENIYKGVKRLGSGDFASPASLSRWLREYLVELLADREKGDKEDIIERKHLITEFIEQNEKQSPYASLPELEQSIITDIEAYMGSDDKKAIRRKLGEITTAIQAREDSLTRIRTTNRWSVPLAVIGLVLTVIFGIISLLK